MSKRKGTRAERELLHLFWQTGQWAVMRAPASGSMQYDSPDLLVGNRLRRLAIECKYCSKSRQYLRGEEIEQLKRFAHIFGAEPWVGVRFARRGWSFLMLEDLETTDGDNYVVSKALSERRGLSFKRLTDKDI